MLFDDLLCVHYCDCLFKDNKISDLEGKLNNMTAKMTEYRNQVETQKKELKIAQKVYVLFYWIFKYQKWWKAEIKKKQVREMKESGVGEELGWKKFLGGKLFYL